MGVNAAGVRFLLHAKASGVDFSRTATIGRLGFHLPLARFASIVRDEFGHAVPAADLQAMHAEGYCDRFLEYLGATVVHSFDYSDYEKSTYKHDLNLPIPNEFHSRYTAVLEGGTLEHVFNFPVAIRNCMQMVTVGGHYLSSTPTNNYMGHGFYQFSPELLFRVFSEENGFRVEHMVLLEGKDSKQWFSVPDPRIVQHRVGSRTALQTLLLVRAVRTSSREIFATPPLQSDYVARWSGGKKVKAGRWERDSLARRVRSLLGLSNLAPYFTPFDPSAPDSRRPSA